MKKLMTAFQSLVKGKGARAGRGSVPPAAGVMVRAPGVPDGAQVGPTEPVMNGPLSVAPAAITPDLRAEHQMPEDGLASDPAPAKSSFTFAPKPAAGVGASLPLAVEVEELVVMENPLFLQVGSVSGCTYKDALAYARSLADGMFPSPESVKFYILEDKVRDRFIYELHEGGPGLSIAEKVIQALSAGESVHIELANGYQASIEEAHGEVFTLRYPPVSEQLLPGSGELEGYIDRAHVMPITAFTGVKKLKSLESDQSILRPIGLSLLGFSTVALLIGGGLWVALKSQVLDGDFVLSQAKLGVIARVQDNPVLHLDRARIEADRTNKAIHKLQKAPGKGWSHELK